MGSPRPQLARQANNVISASPRSHTTEAVPRDLVALPSRSPPSSEDDGLSHLRALGTPETSSVVAVSNPRPPGQRRTALLMVAGPREGPHHAGTHTPPSQGKMYTAGTSAVSTGLPVAAAHRKTNRVPCSPCAFTWVHSRAATLLAPQPPPRAPPTPEETRPDCTRHLAPSKKQSCVGAMAPHAVPKQLE